MPRAANAIEKVNIADTAPFDHLRAKLRRSPGQYFVKFGAPNLIGQRLRFVPRISKSKFLAPPIADAQRTELEKIVAPSRNICLTLLTRTGMANSYPAIR